jgi:hypothetical protein
MARLATAVTAAGVVTALGAATAVAAPSLSWSGPSAPIPGAFTNSSPAISSVAFPGPIGQGTIVAWRGRGPAGHIFYKFRTPTFRGGHWSALGKIPGVTSSAPAIRSYVDPLGNDALIAVWTGPFDHHIFYSQGETHADGTINWTSASVLPPSVAYTPTVTGPSAWFPNNANVVVVAWRAPFNHVRYTIGTPGLGATARNFTWAASAVVPNPPTTSKVHCIVAPCTSATPSVAEIQTGTGVGTMYIFWKALDSDAIFYSTTTDGPSTNWNHLVWSGPTQVPGPGAATTNGPAASALGFFGPLLLVYKGPGGVHVRFQTLTGTTWSPVAFVPTTFTAVGPALRGGTLATTTPTSAGNIILHFFS